MGYARRGKVAARVLASGAVCAMLLPAGVLADEAAAAAPKFDTGDTAWMLTSSALVLMMTIPGLALFYGGLVRPKNVLSTLMHSFFCAALISVTWVLFGYSLAFGPDVGGIVGGTAFFGLSGILGTASSLAPTIPQMLFVVYQGTFAIITPALISGTFAERMRFPSFALFMLLWSTLIYNPLAHWVWGGGWIGTQVGALDFAGGTVVHISSGISALAAALIIGKRRGFGHHPMPPHNLPLTVMGAGLLWFGWFGFNAGSALGANGLAGHAFTTTNTAAAAAALGWMFTEWSSRGKPTVLGAASGAVAGLVAITPAAGFVTPLASIVIGVVAGIICYTACNFKTKLGYDDSLDVVGGTWGALATGIFATKTVNDAGGDGLLYGNPKQLLYQAIAVGVTIVLGFVMTAIILKVLDGLMGLRVSEEDEQAGLDLSQHSETAYALGGGTEYSQTGGSGGAFAEAMRATEAKARSH